METARRRADDTVDLAASVGSLPRTRSLSPAAGSLKAKMGMRGAARRTLGIALLLMTVFLWTLCNFLASLIFSDSTYNKPFLLIYVNTSVFAILLVPRFIKYLVRKGPRHLQTDAKQLWRDYREGRLSQLHKSDGGEEVSRQRLLSGDDGEVMETTPGSKDDEKLGFRETSVLSLEFCILWFTANYFSSACLEYTSVASVTILNSTSSVWTLVFCALFGVERFSLRKFLGVLASLAGVVLISTVDLTGKSDENRGSFPEKTPEQIAIGDAMAFFGAVLYGLYVTIMKHRVGDENKVDMQLFFGMVGVFNAVLLWPMFFILHWTGIEPMGLPPSGKVWLVIIINALSSVISDVSWAYAMLLTTPLVVTVGLSLSIPLSLIGEVIQYGKYSSFIYWIGAIVVFISFLFVNHESHEEAPPVKDDAETQ